MEEIKKNERRYRNRREKTGKEIERDKESRSSGEVVGCIVESYIITGELYNLLTFQVTATTNDSQATQQHKESTNLFPSDRPLFYSYIYLIDLYQLVSESTFQS